MAKVEIYREEGPEKSGLIHFTAFMPNMPELWSLKVHSTSGEVMFGLTCHTNQERDRFVGAMHVTLKDAIEIAKGILAIADPKQGVIADMWTRPQVKR